MTQRQATFRGQLTRHQRCSNPHTAAAPGGSSALLVWSHLSGPAAQQMRCCAGWKVWWPLARAGKRSRLRATSVLG